MEKTENLLASIPERLSKFQGNASKNAIEWLHVTYFNVHRYLCPIITRHRNAYYSVINWKQNWKFEWCKLEKYEHREANNIAAVGIALSNRVQSLITIPFACFFIQTQSIQKLQVKRPKAS
ncbi:uncharacterized protein LOC143184150 [Calliopsis andreniformis]|uniref:uncharacterized protein LOC143184150 n=1 Tax=Calliopsis andreniformis TaxID=337506 RepID=UPI003FCC419B